MLHLGRLSKIHETINGKLPSYNSAQVRLRGLTIPMDVFLSGRVRFARKIGELLPVWLPDNAANLSANSPPQQNRLTIDEPIRWLVPGSKLRLANQVFAFVHDVIDKGFGILVADPLPVNFYTGDNVELYAHPLEVNGEYPATPIEPVYAINILSDHKIYPGDEINVGSFNHEITVAHLAHIHEDGRFQYQLTLATGITSDLHLNRQDQVYLRAYPAYESNSLKTPTVPGRIVGGVGPFLYDRISGPFFTDLTVEEIDIITAYDSTQTILFQEKTDKNKLLYAVSITPDMFLFWDRIRGGMQWNNKFQAFKFIADDLGIAHIHFRCIPVIEPGQINHWRTRITPDVSCTMLVEFELADGTSNKQQFPIDGGRTNTVSIMMPDKSIERIHVMLKTEPGTTAMMKGWDIDTSAIASISHATIAKVSGRFLWGSSVAFAKPYWLRLDYLKTQADLVANDHGLLAL